MDYGIGLPSAVRGVAGSDLPSWAKAAEEHGFARLGVLDRIRYANHEPLLTLAAAAAVTSRIGLATTILIAASRNGAALLGKQLATLQALSAGRLAVGVAAGGREDDFAAAGVSYRDRGRRLDAVLAELRGLWSAGEMVPAQPYGPPAIWVGGHSPAAMRRSARYGQGWIMGASSTAPYAELVGRLRAAWAEAGRNDQPLLIALGYVALGPGARGEAERHLRAYYAQTGPYADRVVASLRTSEAAIADMASEYAAAGCDELILFPCVPRVSQIDLIAKALL